MADEELRLIATFQDRIGPGLKTSIEKIRDFAKQGEKAGADGERSTKKHAEAFAKLRDRLKETVNLSRDEFLPGLEKTVFAAGAAGVGIGTVTAAIGLAAAAAKGFSTSMLDLQRGGRETGLTVEQLQKWQNFAELAGSTAERMRQGAASFNDMIEQMQRRPDIFRMKFATPDMAGLAALRDFVLSLKDLPRDEQMAKVLDFIRTIRDIGQRKQALIAMNLDPALAGQLGEIKDLTDKAASSVTTFTAVQKAMGADAAIQWTLLGQKLHDTSDIVGAEFAPVWDSALKLVNTGLGGFNEEMHTALDDLNAFIEANQAAWGEELRKQFNIASTDIQTLVGWLNKITEWENAQKGVLKILPNGLPVPNVAPIAPNALPSDLDEKRRQFEKLNPGGLIHKSAFVVGGEDGGPGISRGTADMINAIAQGTRRGVYDGLMDFSQTSAAAGGGGGGLMPASFETGGRGAGAGAGGGADPGHRPGTGGAAGRGGGGGGGGAPFDPGNIGLPGSLTKLISDASAKAGIDPRIMEGIRAGESGHGAKYDFNPGTPGHPEMSYGPFQLNRLRGLGVEFEKETADIRKRMGLGDLRDPRTIGLQAYWVAEHIKRTHSTADWMGFHGLRNADPRWGESGYDPRSVPGYKPPDATATAGAVAAAKAAPGAAPGHSKVGGSDPIGDWIKNVPADAFRPKGQAGHEPHHYLSPWGHAEQEASLLRSARTAGAMGSPGVSKIQGEAKLSIELASGLRPSRGVKTEGSLFKEIRIARGSVPYADTEA